MRIETAIEKLKEKYEKAQKIEYVRDPVAWALFHVWKMADEDGRNKREPDK